jgi:ATP-binding protein involved in chromosome partitioning
MSLDTGKGTEEVAIDAEGRFETVVHIFGVGAAERLADKYSFPVIGRVPLNPAVRVGGDGGDPVTVTHRDSAVAQEFATIAGRFAQRLAIQEHKSLPVLQ